jgi:hypothetical protein
MMSTHQTKAPPYGVGFAIIAGEKKPRRWEKLGRLAIETAADLRSRLRRIEGLGGSITGSHSPERS